MAPKMAPKQRDNLCGPFNRAELAHTSSRWPAQRRSALLGLMTAVALIGVAGSGYTQDLAPAGPATQEGADALELELSDWLKTFLGGNPEFTVRFDGEPVAVPDGTDYALAVPSIVLNADDDFEGRLPPFDAVVTPLENGWRDIFWEWTPPATAFEPGGDGRAELTFEPSGNLITYAPDYGVMMNGRIAINDLNLTVSADEDLATARLALLSLEGESEPVSGTEHTFDTDALFTFEGFSISVPEESVDVSLGSATLEASTTGQRMDLFALLAEITRDIDPEDGEAVAAAVGSLLGEHASDAWIGSFVTSFGVADIDVTTPDGSGSLGSASFALEGSGLDSDASLLGISVAVEDIASPQMPPPFAPVVPTLLDASVVAEGLPLRAALDRIYVQTGAGEAEMGPKGRRMGTGFDIEALEDLDPQEFLALLLQSDARLVLETLHVEAPIGRIDASGVVEPAPAAALQAVADVEVRIAGLPEMIAFAQNMGGDAAEAAAAVSLFSAMGRDETDEDGTEVKVFQLELTEAGQVLLNGNDMSAMMGMFQ